MQNDMTTRDYQYLNCRYSQIVLSHGFLPKCARYFSFPVHQGRYFENHERNCKD